MRFLATASFFALLGYGQTQVDLNRQVRNALPYAQGGTNAATQSGARANVGTPDLVATDFSGADIGAKVNAAFASFPVNTCGTVKIPAGSYQFSTTIYIPNNCILEGTGLGAHDPYYASRLRYNGPGGTSAVVIGSPASPGSSSNVTVRDLSILSDNSGGLCPNNGMLAWNPAAGGANKWQCYDGSAYTAPLPHLALIQHGAYDPTVTADGTHNRIVNVDLSFYPSSNPNGTSTFHFGVYLNGCEECYVASVSVFGADIGMYLGSDVNGSLFEMNDMQFNRGAGLEYSGVSSWTCVQCMFQSNQWFGHPDDPTKYGAGVRISNLSGSDGRGARFINTYFEGNHGPDVYGSAASGDITVDGFQSVRGNFGNVNWTGCAIPDASLVTIVGSGTATIGCSITGSLNLGALPLLIRTTSNGTLVKSVLGHDTSGSNLEYYRLDTNEDGTDAASLHLRNSGNTTEDGLRLETVAPATTTTNIDSGWVHWTGNKWNGTASVSYDWSIRAQAETAFTPESTTGLYVFDPSHAKRFGFREDGTFQVPGAVAAKGDTATITVSANAGTGASCFASGFKSSAMAGQLELDTGSGAWSAGAQCDVVFPSFSGFATLTPANAAAAAAMNGRQVYVTAVTNGFRVNFGLADVGATVYRFNWTGAATY